MKISLIQSIGFFSLLPCVIGSVYNNDPYPAMPSNSTSDCFEIDASYPYGEADYEEGEVFKQVAAASAEDCQAECVVLSPEECSWWTHWENGDCFLKSKRTGKEQSVGATSGPRNCVEACIDPRQGWAVWNTCGGTDCYEMDVYFDAHVLGTVLQTGGPSACSAACNTVDPCLFWTWVRSSNDCLLKSGDSGRRSYTGAISGARGCTNQFPDSRGNLRRRMLDQPAPEDPEELVEGIEPDTEEEFGTDEDTARDFLNSIHQEEGAPLQWAAFFAKMNQDISEESMTPEFLATVLATWNQWVWSLTASEVAANFDQVLEEPAKPNGSFDIEPFTEFHEDYADDPNAAIFIMAMSQLRDLVNEFVMSVRSEDPAEALQQAPVEVKNRIFEAVKRTFVSAPDANGNISVNNLIMDHDAGDVLFALHYFTCPSEALCSWTIPR